MLDLPLFKSKKTKDLVIQALVREHPLTVRQLFYFLKNNYSHSITYNGVYRVVDGLLKSKVLAKKGNEYFLSLDFLDQISLINEKVRESYLKKRLFDANYASKLGELHKKKQLQSCTSCNNALPEGFCLLCFEMVCKGCGELVRIHNHSCNQHNCVYCNKLKDMGNCVKCFGEACNHCSKEVWVHSSGYCEKIKKMPSKTVVIGMVEVDHQCWFSNLSGKADFNPELTTFIDDMDRKYKTHSGKVVIDIANKNYKKIIEKIYRQKEIIKVKPVFVDKKKVVLRTRALFENSFEESTHRNDSVILNPIIANNTKEKNIVVASSRTEMQKLVNKFREQGNCRLKFCQEISLSKLRDFDFSKLLGEDYTYTNKKDLDDALRKFQLMYRINDIFGGIRNEV